MSAGSFVNSTLTMAFKTAWLLLVIFQGEVKVVEC